jgi:TPR repeat protein
MANDTSLTYAELALLEEQCVRLRNGDYQGALERFTDFADKGSESAMLSLGWMYENGAGVSLDQQKAGEWLHRAVQAGSSDASYYLGRHLVAMNSEADGVRYLESAVSSGHLPATYELGIVLIRRTHSPHDSERGWKLLQDAAENGHVFAKRKVSGAMLRGKYGLAAIPSGLVMLMTGFWAVLRTGLTDTQSDKLR